MSDNNNNRYLAHLIDIYIILVFLRIVPKMGQSIMKTSVLSRLVLLFIQDTVNVHIAVVIALPTRPVPSISCEWRRGGWLGCGRGNLAIVWKCGTWLNKKAEMILCSLDRLSN